METIAKKEENVTPASAALDFMMKKNLYCMSSSVMQQHTVG
jgi:hypothetical protein